MNINNGNFPKCKYCGKLAVEGICCACKSKFRKNTILTKKQKETLIKNEKVRSGKTFSKNTTEIIYLLKGKKLSTKEIMKKVCISLFSTRKILEELKDCETIEKKKEKINGRIINVWKLKR